MLEGLPCAPFAPTIFYISTISNLKDGQPVIPMEVFMGPLIRKFNEGPTKSYIIEHKDDPELQIYWQLSFGLRPADELYDLRLDPYQMYNVADRTEYTDTLKRLKEKLFAELEKYGDPRVIGGGEAFDQYEYLGRLQRKP